MCYIDGQKNKYSVLQDRNLPTYPNHSNDSADATDNAVQFGSGNNNAANTKPYDNNVRQQPDYEYVTGPININNNIKKPFSYTSDDRNVTSLEAGSANNRPFSYTPEDPTMASLRASSFLKKGPASSAAIPRANLRSNAAEPYYMECLELSALPHNPSESANNTDLQPFAVVSKQQPETPSQQKTKYDSGVKKVPEIHQTDSSRFPSRPQPSATDTNR
jgi:outer membrane receptor protein involved in Fe transport